MKFVPQSATIYITNTPWYIQHIQENECIIRHNWSLSSPSFNRLFPSGFQIYFSPEWDGDKSRMMKWLSSVSQASEPFTYHQLVFQGYASWWEWDLMSGCKGDLKGGWRSPVLPLYTCTETLSYIVKLSKHHTARPTHTRTHTHDECVMNPLEWKGASFPLLSERITCVLNILFFEKTKKKRPLKKTGGHDGFPQETAQSCVSAAACTWCTGVRRNCHRCYFLYILIRG